MKINKKILIVVDWYLPGYRAGGPIKSIAGLVDLLGNNCRIDLITSDRDFQSDKPYEGISVDQWILLSENARICYLSPGLAIGRIKSLLKDNEYSAIYTNSFFSFHYSIKFLLFRLVNYVKADKMVIAPRGEFHNARLQIKPFKKKIFLGAARMLHLYNGVTWHATSTDEAECIQQVFGRNTKLKVLTNVSPLAIPASSPRKKNAGQLEIAFLSRIISYKNLFFILEILSKLRLQPLQQLSFDIYGPVEDQQYWDRCKELISTISSDRLSIQYKGGVKGTEVVEVLGKYHLFFFPTLGENYGHVIMEALLAGTPVLISKGTTPWNNLAEQYAGWDLPLSEKNMFEDVLRKMLNMDQDEFLQYSAGATRLAESLRKDPNLNSGYLELLT